VHRVVDGAPRLRRQGKVVPSLINYAEAARQSAQELGVPFIDLNAMSKTFYEALGPELSKKAFAEPEPGRIDNTHHNSYGSYELAQAVVTGLRQAACRSAATSSTASVVSTRCIPIRWSAFAVPPSPNASRSVRSATRAKRSALSWRPSPCSARAAPVAVQGPPGYLFAYFIGNGEDGLHLAASKDGYRWEKLGGGAQLPDAQVGKSKLMRDPCIVRGPDGTYHMVWTSGWNENGIGYASSKDLVHWSAQREVPVMAHETGRAERLGAGDRLR
jgi:hypothetical protein